MWYPLALASGDKSWGSIELMGQKAALSMFPETICMGGAMERWVGELD